MSLVDLTTDGAVATLTLNRPEAANSLNWDVVLRLEEVLAQIEEAPPEVVLVRSSSGVFSAGLDRAEMRRFLELGPEDLLAERHGFYDRLSRLLRLPVPTVAVVEGPAVTGGVGIAALCDFRLATTSAWFRVTFNELGFYPGLALSVSLKAVAGRSLARRMLLLGERVDADEAHRLGLVDWLVGPEALNAELERVVGLVTGGDSFVVRMMKDRMDADLRGEVSSALHQEALAEAFNAGTERFRRRAERFMTS